MWWPRSETKQDERESDHLSRRHFKEKVGGHAGYSSHLDYWPNYPSVHRGRVHLSPKHPNNLPLCKVFYFFFKQFFYFFMFCCLKSPLLCSLEARHYFYFKVYLKIELQWQKKLDENTTGGWKVTGATGIKKKYFR